MDPQKPGITPIGSVELREINRVFTAIRQRLDGIDRRSVANPASADQVLGVNRLVQQIQSQLIQLVERIDALQLVDFERDGRIARDQLRLPAVNIADGSLAADGSWDARGTRWIDEAT